MRRATTPDVGWVRESRLGVWFQGTWVWRDYVIRPGVERAHAILGPEAGPFETVLDAGCGDGAAFAIVLEKFAPSRLVAVDIDPASVRAAMRVARALGPRVCPVLGDVTELPYADESFDLVFCHQTLHHVSAPPRALDEFFRVLRPGGVLLLAESCRSFIERLWVRALFRHPMEVQRSAAEYAELIRSRGFELPETRADTDSPWWSRADFGLPARLRAAAAPPREPTQWYAVAVRPRPVLRDLRAGSCHASARVPLVGGGRG